MSFYATEFEVVGNGAFPLDMLRYDACFPRGSEDAARIGDTLDRDYRVKHRNSEPIKLTHYSSTSKWMPTKDRWSSFLWGVNPSIQTHKIG